MATKGTSDEEESATDEGLSKLLVNGRHEGVAGGWKYAANAQEMLMRLKRT
jgi:hypothetical protein